VLLSQKERVEEVARMLAGEEVTDLARKNAKEMLSGPNKLLLSA
jgi:DNA repair ATPase RecN